MRVLTIVHDHPAWTTGGTELVAESLTRALRAREGVSARLLAVSTRLHDPEAQPGRLAACGDDFLLCTGAYDRFSMLRRDGQAWIGSLARVLGAVRPEIVHLHGLDRLGAEVVPALRRLASGARIVLTLHDYGLICANEGLMLTAGEGARCDGAAPERCRRCFPSIPAVRHALRRDHLQALLRGVDVFIAPGTFLRDRFVEWGLEAGRIVLIPNAVHVPRKGERDKRDRPNRFGFFGNLAPHKGVLVLLEAAARLKRAGSDISVALHGGFGWQPPELRQHVSEAAAEAAPVARLAGPYAREAVSALMAGVDWMVAPSTWCENAPLTVLEARAAGLPVIASGIGGLADLVADGIDGLHVPPADPVALAEVMARVAEDGRLHRRLARASRPAMTYAHHVDAHLDLFRALSRRAVA